MGGREHAGSPGVPLIQETAGPHSLQVASFVSADGKGPGYLEAGTVSLGEGGRQGKFIPFFQSSIPDCLLQTAKSCGSS